MFGIAGNLKNILTTAFGYFAFNDVTYDVFNVVGLVMGTVAGALYSWFQFVDEAAAKAAKSAASSASALTSVSTSSTLTVGGADSNSGVVASSSAPVHRHVINMPIASGSEGSSGSQA